MDGALLAILRCPETGRTLRAQGDALAAESDGPRYGITRSGIPCLLARERAEASRVQERHYDSVADGYIANLDAPHTREYTRYLDGALIAAAGDQTLGRTLEICCGRGDGFRLLGDRIGSGVGLDVSLRMLESARSDAALDRFSFVQGDALQLPFCGEAFDSVVMLGGIHHVPDRRRLFSEIARVLRPDGRLLFREPADDLFAWRWLRMPVYRLSPGLDARHERPLRRRETEEALESAGLSCDAWETYGFLGFCLFMNSDILVFNRAFARVPGIDAVTRWGVRADDAVRRLPGLSGAGLQVVGRAAKRGLAEGARRG